MRYLEASGGPRSMLPAGNRSRHTLTAVSHRAWAASSIVGSSAPGTRIDNPASSSAVMNVEAKAKATSWSHTPSVHERLILALHSSGSSALIPSMFGQLRVWVRSWSSLTSASGAGTESLQDEAIITQGYQRHSDASHDSDRVRLHDQEGVEKSRKGAERGPELVA